MGMITLFEYAEKHGISLDTVRKKALRGGYETAKKSGNIWLIDEDEPLIDRRIKSGKFIGAREKKK